MLLHYLIEQNLPIFFCKFKNEISFKTNEQQQNVLSKLENRIYL